jgi:spore maturation protein CgeB
MRAYVDLLVGKKVEYSYLSFDELVSRFPIAPGKCIQLNPQVTHYLYWETNNRYRMQVLEALTDFDLRIHGNTDWPALIANSPLQRFFYGEADPVRELPDIFVSSKINLNIHSIQCMGSLNQRDFNAPVAGGFLLSDWVPACAKYFTAGEEAIYWSDISDLQAKIAYYLRHADERDAVVQKGRERVLRDHTYIQRVTQLLQTLPM